MSKFQTGVAIFAGFIIVLFCVMIYLMTTVNPPRLDQNIAEIPDSKDKSLSFKGQEIDNAFYTDSTEFKLEKVESEEIDFYPSTGASCKYNQKNGTGVYRFLHGNAIPRLWPRARETIIVDPTMHIVMPPNQQPSRTKTATDKFSYYRIDTWRNKSKSNMKPMKRRSINNFKLLNNSGSVILNILNGNDHTMIEVKLGGFDDIFQKNKSRKNKGFSKNKPYSSKSLENNNTLEQDTIMTIKSNDSIIIEENEANSIMESDVPKFKNTTDLISFTILISNRHKNNTEIMTNPGEIKKTAKPKLCKNNIAWMYNNETKAIKNDLANSSNINHNITNGTLYNCTDFLTVVTNSSEFNTTEANIVEYDSTEVINILFEDEVPGNITSDANDVNKLRNDTILIKPPHIY